MDVESIKRFPETDLSSIPYFKDNHFEMTEAVYLTALDYISKALENLELSAFQAKIVPLRVK